MTANFTQSCEKKINATQMHEQCAVTNKTEVARPVGGSAAVKRMHGTCHSEANEFVECQMVPVKKETADHMF